MNHVTQPNSKSINDDVENRLIMQQFDTEDVVLNLISPHNCDVRISNSTDWPPDLLFDITYGTAAFKSWGDPDFRALLQGINNRGKGDSGAQVDNTEPSAHDKRAARWAEAEDQAGDTQAVAQDDCMDLVLALWAHNARKHQDEAEVTNADRTQD